MRGAKILGEKGYPEEVIYAIKSHADYLTDSSRITEIRDGEARCRFEGVSPGRYAVSVMHDEDADGELDTGLFGIPEEGWGVSNDAPAGAFGPPSFESAAFAFDGGVRAIRIRIQG